MKKATFLTALSLAVSTATAAPLSIEQQGSFAIGGTVKTSAGSYNPTPAVTQNDSNSFWAVYQASTQAGGQTLHGDHATVSYQIPSHAKGTPLVFLHGFGQSARSWQTTPDGREGFNNIFLRKGYPVYLIDQPRRGQAGRSSEDADIKATPDDQFWYAQFRMGVYPNRNAGSAFPQGKVAEDQFFRTITPDVGKFDVKTVTDSMVKLFEQTAGVFITHSAGGLIGWTTAMQSDSADGKGVKGIIAIEPGGFPFPENAVPATIKNRFGDVAPMKVSEEQFAKLTKMPIVIYFGDFIPDTPDGTQGGDQWYARLKMAQLFVAEVNKRGGDAKVVRLPEIGIKGNTHFPMFDVNNQQVAEEMARWLNEKNLK